MDCGGWCFARRVLFGSSHGGYMLAVFSGAKEEREINSQLPVCALFSFDDRTTPLSHRKVAELFF